MSAPKVRTDKELIDKFLNRGVDNIFPTKDALRKKLMSGERIKAYQGFDPSGPFLHIGHAMGIRGLRILQELGHEVVFLIGDFTARVGDPDKDKGRKLLSPEDIEKNANGWKQQAAQLIDFEGENPVQFGHNFDWLSKLKLEDLIDLMHRTTVQQMIERDMFQRRLAEKDPIGLQEFIYPLMQGYDSVAMKVDLEIGGTDQIFNMLVGRALCKSYLGKEKFVRANILMEAPDARTMSKTKGNGINLSDSSEDMYGKAMSYPDELIIKGMTLLTDIPLEEIHDFEQEMKNGENPMKYKKLMAFEILNTIKGKTEAEEAEKYFENTVQNKAAPEDTLTLTFPSETTVLNAAVFINEKTETGLSNSDIKRLIVQGGFKLNETKLIEQNATISPKSNDIFYIR